MSEKLFTGTLDLNKTKTKESAETDQTSLWAHCAGKQCSFIYADTEESDRSGMMIRRICFFVVGSNIALILQHSSSNSKCMIQI